MRPPEAPFFLRGPVVPATPAAACPRLRFPLPLPLPDRCGRSSMNWENGVLLEAAAPCS
jgi:hypothetical protein